MTDWDKLRKEYVAGGISLRGLAKKYGLNPSTVMMHSAQDGWKSDSDSVRSESRAKAYEAIAQSRAGDAITVYDAAQKLLEKCMVGIEMADGSPDQLSKFGSALRAVQMIFDSKPKDLDIREQEARIKKLQRECDESAGGQNITVVLEGGLQEYAD